MASFSEFYHSSKCCVLRRFIINEFIGVLGTFTSADIATHSHTPASKNASIIRLSITTARVWQTVYLSNHRLAQATREPPWGGAACTEQGTEARQTVHFHIHDRVYVNILNEQCVALNNTGSLRWETRCEHLEACAGPTSAARGIAHLQRARRGSETVGERRPPLSVLRPAGKSEERRLTTAVQRGGSLRRQRCAA